MSTSATSQTGSEPGSGSALATGFGVVLALAAALGLTGSLAAEGARTQPPDPSAPGLSVTERYDALVARVAHERADLRTLEADFVQLETSRFLLEPEESSGTFSYRSPDQVRWHFTSPVETITILDGSRMTTWTEGQPGSEVVDVGRRGAHVLELIGPSASLEALQRYFTVRATFPESDRGPYQLHLDPRIPRVERRIRSMTLHLDPAHFLPVYVRLEEAGGEVTEMRFSEPAINGEIPDARFELEPEGGRESGLR